MKSILKTMTKVLGVASAAAALSTGALAADYGSGTKGGSNAIAVPAPIPVADFEARYYFRVDASYGWSDASGYTTSYDAATLGYADTSRLDEGFSEFGRYGIGGGIYFSPYLRGDLTFDLRNEVEGTALFTEIVGNPPGQAAGVEWTRSVDDVIASRDGTMLVNGYIDLPVVRRFRPYVGAGVGVAVHRLNRMYSQSTTCSDDNGGLDDCDSAAAGIQVQGDQLSSVTGREKNWTFGFAGALMAGAVVDVSPNWKLDLGYRFLHLGGVDFSHRIQGTQAGLPVNSSVRVNIPDQNIHELRVGLRYDIE